MNVLVSLMRTLVPLLVGWVLTASGWIGLAPDSTAVTAAVTAAVSAVYYTVLRAAEELAGRLRWRPARLVAGLLLGWAAPPDYPTRRPPGDDLSALLRERGQARDRP